MSYVMEFVWHYLFGGKLLPLRICEDHGTCINSPTGNLRCVTEPAVKEYRDDFFIRHGEFMRIYL